MPFCWPSHFTPDPEPLWQRHGVRGKGKRRAANKRARRSRKANR